MSAEAMSWAMRADLTGPLSAEHRLVLLTLADYADPHGGNVWPSRATVADRLGTSVKSVSRALARLQARGLIVHGDQSVVSHIRKDRRPTVYHLRVGTRSRPPAPETEPLPTEPLPTEPEPAEAPAARGDSSVPTGQQCPPARGDSSVQNGGTAVSPKPRTRTPNPPSPPTPTPSRAGVRRDGTCRLCDRHHPLGPCPPHERADAASIRAIRARAIREDTTP